MGFHLGTLEIPDLFVWLGERGASTVATVNGCIDLDPQQFRTCRCIGHHLHSADHAAGYADGVLTSKRNGKMVKYD